MPALTAPTRRTTFLLVAIQLVLGGGGLFAWFHLATRESTDDAQVDGHIISVASRVPGTVTAVHVLDNQWVQAGDPLVEAHDHRGLPARGARAGRQGHARLGGGGRRRRRVRLAAQYGKGSQSLR